jgi:transposase
VQEKNRLKSPDNSIIIDSIKTLINFLTIEITSIEKKIENIIISEEKEKYNLLISQKGIGKQTAFALIATLPELGKVKNTTIANIAGVAPLIKQSGKSLYKSHTGRGRGIKKKLFIVVLSMLRYDKTYQAKIERFLKRGKCKMICIIAICRTLIIKLNAMVRDMYKNNCILN